MELQTSDKNRSSISATFMQPFLAYITQSKTTFTVNSETTYDWKNDDWSIPINLMASQLLRGAGSQIIQIGGGLRYWADASDFGPEGLGARLQLTFLFPK
jgi:hypothetical protein